MTDRPIIFSAPMVRALLDGRKTQTRRMAWGKPRVFIQDAGGPIEPILPESPWQKVKPGDRLWVRENFAILPRNCYALPKTQAPDPDMAAFYMADFDRSGKPGWKPSIHMPRWASRLTLTITAVKVEPLLDISDDDARAEGFEAGQLDDGFGPREIGGGFTIESPGTFCSAAGMFQVTWAKLHPEWDGYSSPDVVALTFKVERGNIGP